MMPWISSQLSFNRPPTAFWLAAFNHSIASASNRAVKRLDGSAHGSFDYLDSVLVAFAPGRLGMQDRLILACVQVPPPTLRLMVVQFAGRPTLRTRPIDHLVMPEKNVDLAHFELQIY
jgi:hypothetical protein